ncbi:MAG: hypothetical protein ACPGJS_22785 [Flammeovirgaceae bacterium]
MKKSVLFTTTNASNKNTKNRFTNRLLLFIIAINALAIIIVSQSQNDGTPIQNEQTVSGVVVVLGIAIVAFILGYLITGIKSSSTSKPD